MVWILRKCIHCKTYTLRTDGCPLCGRKVVIPNPPPFVLEDRYRSYRRMMKRIGETKMVNNQTPQ